MLTGPFSPNRPLGLPRKRPGFRLKSRYLVGGICRINPDGPSRTNEQQDEQAAAMGGSPPAAFKGVNANAELVADLLAATGLLSEDKLNVVRGSAGQGSLAQAIVSEGYA